MKETDGIDYLEGYKKGKQEGIREVVDWIESLRDTPTYSVCEGTNLRIPEPPAKIVLREDLEAFKKKRGL